MRALAQRGQQMVRGGRLAWYNAAKYKAIDTADSVAKAPSAIADFRRWRFALPKLGPELASPTGWVMTAAGSAAATNSGGTLTLTGDGTNAGFADQSFATEPGKTYQLVYTIGTSAAFLAIGTAIGSNNITNGTPGAGTYKQTFIAVTSTTYLRFQKSAATAVVTGISIREVSLAALGPIQAASGYTMSVSGSTGTATESPLGTLTLSGDGTNPGVADKQLVTQAGATYQVTLIVSGNQCGIWIGTAQGGGNVAQVSGTGTGVHVFTFVATGSNHWLRFFRTTLNNAVLAAITVRQISGYGQMRSATFDEWFTFTSGGGSYVDASGQIKTAAANVPRVDYTNGVGQLALNAAATNFCPQNTNMVSAWQAGSAGGAYISALAPEVSIGDVPVYIAYKGDVATSQRYISAALTTFTAGTTYVFSAVFGRPAVDPVRYMQITGSGAPFGTAQWATFDLQDGVVVNAAGGSAYITRLPNGLFRCEFAVTATATATGATFICAFTNGAAARLVVYDSTDKAVYFAAPQCEVGSRASPIILTGASAVTRPIETAQFGLLAQMLAARSFGTMIIQSRGRDTFPGSIIGDASGSILFVQAANPSTVLTSNGVTDMGVALGSGAFATGYGAGIAWSSNGRSIAANGAVASDAAVVKAVTTTYIARGLGTYGDGWYDTLTIYPFRVANANLQTKAMPYAA